MNLTPFSASDMLTVSSGLGGPSSTFAELTVAWPLVAAPIAWIRDAEAPLIHMQSRKQRIDKSDYHVEIGYAWDRGNS